MRRGSSPELGSAGRLSSVGLELGLSIIGCLVLGWYLDKRLDTDPWLALLGLLIGSFAGFRALFRSLALHDEETDKDRR